MDTDELRVTTTEVAGSRLDGLRTTGTMLAIAGAVLTGAAVLMGASRMIDLYASWVFGWVFWFGVSAGALGLLMMHHTVGGGWGFVLRRFFEAAANPLMFVLLAVLFLPILAGLFGVGLTEHHLFEWTHRDPADKILAEKSPWLNTPFFIVRTVLYFVFFIAFGALLLKWGRVQDERLDQRNSDRLNNWSARGILLFVLVGTFCSVDWVMSLTPHWLSSIFGLLWVASQGLSALTLLMALFAYLGADKPLVRGLPTKYFRDIGNLTLANIMLWAYMAFSQYLIIFSGNTAENASWYTTRLQSSWLWLGLALIIFHFSIPFLILLIDSDTKKNPAKLGRVGWLMVGMRVLDVWWLVAPTFRPQFSISLTDIGVPALIGGLWLIGFATFLKDRPVVPLYDPRFQAHADELQEAHAHG